MASKGNESGSGFFKKVFFLLFLTTCALGGYWVYLHRQDIEKMTGLSEQKQIVETFEISTRPEDIIQKNTSDLLPTKQHSIGPITLFFSPHLLLNIKYMKSPKETKNSVMLWDLLEGELVLSTDTFDLSQGFHDCLVSQASYDDFRLLHTLTKAGGTLTKGTIIDLSGVEEGCALERIDSLRKRHLVTVSGDLVHLHVESPLFKAEPTSIIKKPFVQKETSRGTLLSSNYSEKEVQNLVNAAFGKDLAIRASRIIWIPVYEIQVMNPDGSLRKTYWNALSGKEVLCKDAHKIF